MYLFETEYYMGICSGLGLLGHMVTIFKTISFFIILQHYLQLLLFTKSLLVAPINVNSPLNEFPECIYTTGGSQYHLYADL